jgi:hypothetical protein
MENADVVIGAIYYAQVCSFSDCDQERGRCHRAMAREQVSTKEKKEFDRYLDMLRALVQRKATDLLPDSHMKGSRKLVDLKMWSSPCRGIVAATAREVQVLSSAAGQREAQSHCRTAESAKSKSLQTLRRCYHPQQVGFHSREFKAHNACTKPKEEGGQL